MGVDYEICTNCEDTFPDCGYFVRCDCGRQWCDDDCASADGFESKPSPHGEDYEDETSCSYCRGESFETHELLETALAMLGIDHADLVARHKKKLEVKASFDKLVEQNGGALERLAEEDDK